MVNSVRAKPLREKQVVWLGRTAILVCGTLSMLLTLDPPAFTLAYGGDIWGVVSILLFPPLYGTLLGKKITRRGVWACVIVGILSIAVFYPLYYGGTMQAHPAMYGVLLSTVAMFAVSAADHRRGGGS